MPTKYSASENRAAKSRGAAFYNVSLQVTQKHIRSAAHRSQYYLGECPSNARNLDDKVALVNDFDNYRLGKKSLPSQTQGMYLRIFTPHFVQFVLNLQRENISFFSFFSLSLKFKANTLYWILKIGMLN